MKTCDYCGVESPVHAQFCGKCGRSYSDLSKGVTEITNPLQADTPTVSTRPFYSDPSYPPIKDKQAGLQNTDVDMTMKQQWPEQQGLSQPLNRFNERQTDENRTVLADGAILFAPPEPGQFPAGNVPAVQGTPQVGGVPVVQGTPPPPGHALPGQAIAHNPGSAAPQQTWTWEQQHSQQPLHPAHHPQPSPSSPDHHGPREHHRDQQH